MSTHETALALEYLVSTLSGDSTLMGYCPGGVNRGYAPPSTATPYIIIAFQAGTDAPVFGTDTEGFANMVFQVKAVGPAKGTATLLNAAARIQDLLPTKQISVTGGTIKGCYRWMPLLQDELEDGEQWLNAGGLYRIFAKSS